MIIIIKRVGNVWKINYVEYESSADGNKNLSVKEYLNKIKLYLRDIIINLQKSDTWRIQWMIEFNFTYSKDVDEECVMHSRIDNIEFMSYDNINEIVIEFFKSLLSRYQIGLETSNERELFFLDSVQILNYKFIR